MSKIIKMEDVLGETVLQSVTELRYALWLGVSLTYKGYTVDFSSIRVLHKDSKTTYGYLRYWLSQQGALGVSVPEDDEISYVNMEEVTKLKDKFLPLIVPDETGNGLYVDLYDVLNDLVSHTFQTYDQEVLLYFVANHIATCYYTGKDVSLTLKLTSGAGYAFWYDTVSAIYSLPSLSKIVKTVDDENGRYSSEFSIFYYDATTNGTIKEYSVLEKVNILEKLGFKEGFIGVLFERKGYDNKTGSGGIGDVTLAEIVGIQNGELVYNCLSAVRTKEEILHDYNQIPEENRLMFSDLLDYRDSCTDTRRIALRDLAIDGYMGNELYLFTSISSRSKVDKMVTKGGDVVTISLDEPNAIYYTLAQNNYNFNKEYFRKYYFGGEDAFWDKLVAEGEVTP